ncbi:phosphoglycerate dehydrogenase-like enzyme [Homoserinimonas aerilata]|uniref:Phosphoglycerate dehydrogenase-like enzyme n=1 Tax=Homoserinimonas aerilata TaxID=1162970 RepID=A0A542YGZ8_9MICO|nr:NAD(P)-dependent oxidoreductase [Homoserinimonas aerilata]TQL47254.1 phosphoglycerate dehydrogenase-like enzyme [Homoserinimonas aerilata]
MKVLIPTSVALSLSPINDVEYIEYDPVKLIPAEHDDADVLVSWANPSAVLEDAATRLTRLRLVQTLSAGVDQALAAGFDAMLPIASGTGLHDRPVAEHALALVLAAARRLHVTFRAQLDHRWAAEVGGVQPEPSPGLFSTLRGARVLVWGFGGIARELTPHLVSLGATVTGVATSARTTDGHRVIATEDVASELPTTDVLINILPATDATQNIVDAAVLAQLPAHAWLVNVGRGATVDEGALLDAIRAGRLGGAALDVTAQEPLPADSPLWDETNIIITPHAAGGRPLGAEQLIEHNVRVLLDGGELRNRVR